MKRRCQPGTDLAPSELHVLDTMGMSEKDLEEILKKIDCRMLDLGAGNVSSSSSSACSLKS